MSRDTVIVETDGPVATITLNRPERLNAISPELRDDLEGTLRDLKAGDTIRVIRLRGAGRGFCSGYDLASGSSVYHAGPAETASDHRSAASDQDGTTRPTMAELGEAPVSVDRERLRESIERWLALWNYRKPIIGQVHGACLAGGLDLIAICDLVYAADDATFGHPAARGMGIPPTLGMLPVKIGAAATKELFFTGDLIDAAEAHRLGLVNAVIPAAELEARTTRLCRRIAAQPLDALTLHKHVINRWSEIMGVRVAALEGAEFDAIFHVTPASAEFGRIAAEEGLRAALTWRDAGFEG